MDLSGPVAALSARIGPERPEPDREVADARRVALDHVEAGPRAAAEHVAVDRRRRAARRPGRRPGTSRASGENTPRYTWAVPSVGARRAADDRDLVDDDVAAAQQRPIRVRADREHRDQHRHRDPRPLAPVEPAQDEVVDRAR